MKVVVEAVTSRERTDCRAIVRTSAGNAPFRIRTRLPQIAAGAAYSAELEIDAQLQRDRNVWSTAERDFRITSDGSNTTLVGSVDGTDPDGLVYFRLGIDSLVMIDAVPGQFDAGEWLKVVVPSDAIKMFLT